MHFAIYFSKWSIRLSWQQTVFIFQAVCELLANANVIQELNLSNTECPFDLVIMIFCYNVSSTILIWFYITEKQYDICLQGRTL